MAFDPAVHHRRSIRLKGYEYSQPGLYFVTICAWRGRCDFGRVLSGRVCPSKLGEIIQKRWWELPSRFGGLEPGEFVVMPNHIHGLIGMSGHGYERRPLLRKRLGGASPAPTPAHYTLPDVIRAFKSLTTLEARRALQLRGPLWQRGYYEHIIRNSKDFEDIREYIRLNPLRWEDDPEHP